MGGTIWCFYDSYKLLVTIPAVIASIIVGTRTWRKRRRLNKQVGLRSVVWWVLTGGCFRPWASIVHT